MKSWICKHEPELLENKEYMPDDYQEKMKAFIVGFKIVVERIEGKEKLGQHRKLEDQEGVYNALQIVSPGLARYMAERKVGVGV